MSTAAKPTAATPSRTQAVRRAATEARLLDAAFSIVADYGVRAVTTAAVGELAGYSRGIVNHHFGSRDQLMARPELITAIRSFIRRFNSSDYSNALALGEVCLVVGWSGDIKQAQRQTLSSERVARIGYSIPDDRAQMWLDNLAIPKGAPHPEEAHAFIDFMLIPEMAASGCGPG